MIQTQKSRFNTFFRIFVVSQMYVNDILDNKFIGRHRALYRILIYLNSTQKIKFNLYWWLSDNFHIWWFQQTHKARRNVFSIFHWFGINSVLGKIRQECHMVWNFMFCRGSSLKTTLTLWTIARLFVRTHEKYCVTTYELINKSTDEWIT